ncbi:MAG: hypothetical protein LUH02_01210 [Erysipelotrichaceae bacterium]|nr:hypothetical protein [Erysipelotrichaceae bacterium]
MKRVSKDYRKGYILALDSCIREGFILKEEKELLLKAFDKMYEVSDQHIINAGKTLISNQDTND